MKKRSVIVLSLLLMLIALTGCGNPASEDETVLTSAEPLVTAEPPATQAVDHDWEFDQPQNHGMDAGILRNLHDALEETEIHSVIIVKDGYIVDEFYQEGYDEASIFRLNSCSKSFTSALIGIALEEGLIDDLDTRISAYFPQLAGTEKARITIRNLLEHRSGLEWHEWTRNGESFYELNSSGNWVDYILNKPLVAASGTLFNYTTGGSHLLAAILEQATEESLMTYAQKRLFAPLGMTSVRWRADPQGILDGGNGIEMTVRDAAKFGQLYLNGGRWHGQQLVAREWVEASTKARVVRSGNSGSYGYQWWRRSFGTAHYETFFAMGARGQFIFVVPELNLVAVTASDTSQYAPYPYFADYILEACG